MHDLDDELQDSTVDWISPGEVPAGSVLSTRIQGLWTDPADWEPEAHAVPHVML